MAIKVDLEKAYDRLRWDFIEDTLVDLGIPSGIIRVIMNCVSSSSMQLLWNGSPTKVFRPSRGMRQGCPLPPYHFVLCMERLGHSITAAIEANEWTPISLVKHGRHISHLFFADDLMLFCKANVDNVRTVKKVLEEFSICSGHRVSVV